MFHVSLYKIPCDGELTSVSYYNSCRWVSGGDTDSCKFGSLTAKEVLKLLLIYMKKPPITEFNIVQSLVTPSFSCGVTILRLESLTGKEDLGGVLRQKVFIPP